MGTLPSESSGLTVDTVEWLPSGGATGLLRIRGRWTRRPARAEAGLPVLVVGEGPDAVRHLSLPEPGTGAEPDAWRGAYILRAELVESGALLALETEWGHALAVPLPAPPTGHASPPRVAEPEPEPEDRGGEVIDRAVLAERRARRAEEAERTQTKVAAEALKALEALEVRGSELELRVQELTRSETESAQLREDLAQSRDEAARSTDALSAADAEAARLSEALTASEIEGARLAEALTISDAELGRLREEASASKAELERAQAAVAAAEAESRRQQAELRAALDSLEALREELRGWAARERSAELARTSDSVRLAVLQADLEKRQEELRVARETLAERDRQLERLSAQAGLAASTIEEAYGAASTARDELLSAEARSAALRSELGEAEARSVEIGSELAAALEAARLRDLELATEREAVSEVLGRLRDSQAVAAVARAELRVERVARITLEAELQGERARRAGAEAQRDREEAKGEEARAALAVASEALQARREKEEAKAEEARAALAVASNAAREQMRDVEAALVAARARIAALETQTVVDESAARAATLPAARPMRRYQALAPEGAGSPGDPTTSARLRHDLDAAATALRARTPRLLETDVSTEESTGVALEPTEGPGSPGPAGSPEGRRGVDKSSTVALESSGAPSLDAIGPARPLRDVLVDLATEEPATAARLIASLLPAQGALVGGGRLNYDLVIAELGTLAVTVKGSATSVRRLATPRSRLIVDFRIVTSALPLARVLHGSGPPLRRLGGPLRLIGRRGRRARQLVEILPTNPPSFTSVARAGARFEPGDVLRALVQAIDPSWTRGQSFTVGLEVSGEGGGNWYLTVADAEPVGLRSGLAPGETAAATVVMDRPAFDSFLRGESRGPEGRPRVRGDREAVARLKEWTDRARAAT